MSSSIPLPIPQLTKQSLNQIRPTSSILLLQPHLEKKRRHWVHRWYILDRLCIRWQQIGCLCGGRSHESTKCLWAHQRDGEIALEVSGVRHLILRTSWVAGTHGRNFSKTILRLPLERVSLNVVADQYGVPTPAALLADVTAQLIRQNQREGEESFPFGLYHLVTIGEANWREYARFVVSEALVRGKSLRLSPNSIHAIPTSEYPLSARRPANLRLNMSKLRRAVGFELPDWQVGVRHIFQILAES